MNASPTAIDKRAEIIYRRKHQQEPSYTKIYWSVANEIGLAQAFLIQVVESWCQSNCRNNKRGYFQHNEWWTAGPYREWARMYPALGGHKNVQRLFLALERNGYIISAQPNKLKGDATKFYRIDSEKVGNLLLQDLSVVQKNDDKNDTGITALPIVANNSGVVANNSGVVANNSGEQAETLTAESFQPSNNISQTILLNQITEEREEQEKEEKRFPSYQDLEIKSSASYQDLVKHENSFSANKNPDLATPSISTHEDTLCGAARTVFTDNAEVAQSTDDCTMKVEVIHNTSVDSQQNNVSAENDSQALTFFDDPLQEPSFLGYYKTMKSRDRIINPRSYVTTLLADANKGKVDVMIAFQDWMKACSTLGRKISDFAQNPEEVAKQKDRYDFANWGDRHRLYKTRLLNEGLRRFCTHELSAKWYQWAIANKPEMLADEKIPD
ncbi:MAG: hypothetical protein KME49_25315 [Brasilonema octagenarum HA4186-MV1]|jgi:hypothetical protein|nr:hypothetical protein [Brasilonema octagenarum HA4186-MV1]